MPFVFLYMNAIPDQNHYYSKLAVLNTDTVQGTNLIRLKINGSNNGIMADDSATISFTMIPVTPQDENYKDCWLFQGTDGQLYPAVATSTGKLLVDL